MILYLYYIIYWRMCKHLIARPAVKGREKAAIKGVDGL